MRKYFFKAAYIALIAVFATFLSAGLISLNGEKAVANGEISKTYEDTTVTAFGDPGGATKDRLFFTLSANDYSAASQKVDPTQVASLNWTSKIKITIGGEEKTLADCYTATETYLNLWGRAGAPVGIHFKTGDYTAITKIVVEKGCEFPSSETAEATDNLKVYRTTEEAVFYNVGKALFYKEAAYTVATATETKVETFGDPAGEVTKRLFFGLSVNDYSAATQAVSLAQSGKLNWNTKIKITVNGEEKVLAAYAPIAETYLRIFDRAGAPVALTTSLSDYKTIEKIVIEKGCHFPSNATANNEDNFNVFVTTETVTFIGDGNGHFTKCVGQTAVTAIGDPSDDRQKQFLWVCLDTNDYNTPNNPIELWQFSALNTGSKIKLTVAGEVKTLGDYGITGQSYLNLWGRADMMAIASGLPDYTVATKIVIEKGCQFPANVSATHKATANYFETTDDAVFVNDGTGKFVNLIDVKSAAKKEIEGYNSKNLFEAAEKERAAIVVQAKADIENGDTYEGISTVVFAAKAAIDKLETAPDVGLIGGASIRTSVPYGIRWTAKIRTADWEKLATLYGEENVKAGVLVLPYDSLTDGVEFTVEALGAAKIPYQQIETDIFNETASNDAGDGYSGFYASLVNIKAGNLNRKFIARAYISVTSGDATICYYGDYSAENQARSIYEVSKKVIVSNTESEATKQFAMTGVLDKVVEVIVSGGAATLVQTDGYTSPYSVSVSGGTLTITAADASGAYVNDIGVVCVNGKNYKPTVSNGVVTVSIN